MTDPLSAILLFFALIGFYVSARAVGVWSRAVVMAMSVPLAGVVAVAAAMGRPEIALGAALSAAVAAVGLVGGMVLMQRRAEVSTPAESGTWTLLVPVALSILLVGLAGNLTPVSVGALLLLALVLIPAVRCPPLPVPGEPAAAPLLTPETTETPSPNPRRTGIPRAQVVAFVTLGCAISLLAGWAAIEGASQLSLRNAHAPVGLLAACVLGPASTMPLLGLAIARATDGHTYHALGLCVRFVLVAVLVLVPLAALIHFAKSAVWGTGQFSMPFPPSLWRVETVLLLAFSVLLVPLASGRLTPRRRDGVLLLLLYVVYLVLSAIGGARLL